MAKSKASAKGSKSKVAAVKAKATKKPVAVKKAAAKKSPPKKVAAPQKKSVVKVAASKATASKTKPAVTKVNVASLPAAPVKAVPIVNPVAAALQATPQPKAVVVSKPTKPMTSASQSTTSWSESIRKALQDKHGQKSWPGNDKADWKNRQRAALSMTHRNKFG